MKQQKRMRKRWVLIFKKEDLLDSKTKEKKRQQKIMIKICEL